MFLAYLSKVKSNTVILPSPRLRLLTWTKKDYCVSYMFLVVLKIFLKCSINSEFKPALRLLALRVLPSKVLL